jgi:hypothetical protein
LALNYKATATPLTNPATTSDPLSLSLSPSISSLSQSTQAESDLFIQYSSTSHSGGIRMPTGRSIAIPAYRIMNTKFYRPKKGANGQYYVPLFVEVWSINGPSKLLQVRFDGVKRTYQAVSLWKDAIKSISEVVLRLHRERDGTAYWIFGDQDEELDIYDTDQLYSSDDEKKRRRSRERT